MKSKADIMETQLSQEEVKLIQGSYYLIGDSGEMASDFYNRLFFSHPELRPLFKENIHFQANKFATLIFYIIHNIQDWPQIQNGMDEFRQEYVNSELKPRHYVFVRDAFFYSLKHHLKRSWNSEVEAVWQKFYHMLIQLFIGSDALDNAC